MSIGRMIPMSPMGAVVIKIEQGRRKKVKIVCQLIKMDIGSRQVQIADIKKKYIDT